MAERDGEVLGWASYGRFAEGRVRHHREHSIYCRLASLGLGVGTALMGQLIERAREGGVHLIFGVLDADNTASLSLHRRLGFVESARVAEAGRKFGRWLTMTMVYLHLDN